MPKTTPATPFATSAFKTAALAAAAFFGTSIALLGCPGPQPSTIATGGQAQGPSSSSGMGASTPASSTPASSSPASSVVASSASTSATSSSGSSGSVGSTCTTPADCAGGPCVQGFCCDSACTGTCMACTGELTGKANGTCAAVMMGAPSPNQGDCPPTAECGNDGSCNGSGGCELVQANTMCSGPATCSGQMILGNACDGQGNCKPSTMALPCPNDFACQNDACPTTCTSGADCVSSYSCNIETGTCDNDGETCALPSDCTSGVCGPGPAPRCCTAPCGTDPTCGASSCDTTGACVYPPASTTCSASKCSGQSYQTFGLCDGQGSCTGMPSTQLTCTPYSCADQVDCNTSCTTDNNCAFGYYCSGNVCVGQMQPGNGCTANDQCVGGTCATNCCTPNPSQAACLVGTSNPCGATMCDSSGLCGGYVAVGTPCGAGQTCDGAGTCAAGTLVFVSSMAYTATFNGTTKGAKGADDVCQGLGAKFGGTWIAWTSDDNSTAKSRFTQTAAPFRLLNGTLVATSLSAMLSGTIGSNINIDETGALQSSVTVWTGTGIDGSEVTSPPCANWTSTSSSANQAEIGTSSTSSVGWTEDGFNSCTLLNHIYCFQQ